MIASMAHPNLKSGAATRNSVAFRYQLKIHVNGRAAEDRSPCPPSNRQRTLPTRLPTRCG